ncbi:neuronal acetylcholine receptor subunit alpha-10-like [Oculina patagonica]
MWFSFRERIVIQIVFLALFFATGGSLKQGRNVSLIEMDDDEQRLLNYLFTNYNPRLRPVLNKSHVVTVTFGISLHQIIDVDEKNQLLQTSIWVRQVWNNPFLVWNESDFGGIKSINVEASTVWTPDIYLYNNADHEREGGMDQFNTQIVINSSGWNKWLTPVILYSSCKMDVKYFPFDTQACDLKFGSWTYDGFRLDMVPEAPFADTKKFVSNGEWQLIAFPSKRNVIHYVCCPEPYPDVTFTLQIQRLALFYYINLIIPCLLITLLTVTAFYLPPESGERITLVITNLLAMTVFMLLVAEIMPSTSEVIPVISIYFSGTIFEVSLALLATCFILKCHFHDPASSDMPAWIRHVVFKWMAQMLRFKIPKKRKRSTFGTQQQEHTAASQRNETTEHRRNDKPNFVQGATSVDALFVPRNGVQSLVKQLSHSNLMNGNYKSGPNFTQQGGLGSLPKLTVTQVEDWCIASSHVSLCSNEDDDQRLNSESGADDETRPATYDDRRMEELLKMQEKLLEHVQILSNVVTENEQLQEKKDEWNMVAAIFDRVFRIAFFIMFFLSTLTIFYFSKG